MAECREFIEEVEHRRGRPPRRSGHVLQALRHHQAQPSCIGTKAIRRQDQEHRRDFCLQIAEGKIRMSECCRHARAVEEMGVALRGRKHPGRFAMILAEMPVGGARNQSRGGRGTLHPRKQIRERLRRRRQMFAQGRERSPVGRFLRDDVQNESGDQRLGFLIPMRFRHLSGRIIDQRVGQDSGLLRHIQAGCVE